MHHIQQTESSPSIELGNQIHIRNGRLLATRHRTVKAQMHNPRSLKLRSDLTQPRENKPLVHNEIVAQVNRQTQQTKEIPHAT
jgi:hypothetical protein